jgi:pimeloyl-ACP methyl ester carboxylesterase/ketosteroid isomerase-like protein
MRKVIGVLVLLAALPSFAADPAEEAVRQTEIAFAKAFADRDVAKFFGFLLDDATFLGGLSTQRGRQAVVERWTPWLTSATAPFSWGPDRVAVNKSGTLGLSTGPVFDANGRHVGSFTSTWVKQPDGTWKILFDGNGPSAAVFADDAIKVEEGFVTTADGVKLHYRKAGAGPVTLIIPLEFVMFDDFKQFADVATVISYDLRNRGRSQAAANVTIQHDLDDLEAVRKHFKVEKFVPIGYSYLGKLAVMYALKHPERVLRIVQLGPGPMRDDVQYPASLRHGYEDMGNDPAVYAKWQEQRAAGAAAKTPREFCDLQWNGIFNYLLVGNPKHVSRVKNPCAMENEWPVNFEKHMATHWESVKKASLPAEEVKKVTVPVLVVHGTKDRNAPYGSGRDWALTLPDARLVTVPGAAHQSWSDDPATVFGAIRQFLRRDWPMGSEKVTTLVPASSL